MTQPDSSDTMCVSEPPVKSVYLGVGDYRNRDEFEAAKKMWAAIGYRVWTDEHDPDREPADWERE